MEYFREMSVRALDWLMETTLYIVGVFMCLFILLAMGWVSVKAVQYLFGI